MGWGICGLRNSNRHFSMKKIYICFGLIYSVLFLLTLLSNVSRVIIGFSFLILSFLFIYFIRRSLLEFIRLLEDILDNMIEGKEINEQNLDYRDDLFSKLMHKLWKMNSIHQHTQEILENEKNNIEGMVSDIAHQVKTPMTNIKMYHEILFGQLQDQDKYIDTFGIIQSQVNKLDFLIQSILKISELEIGIINLNQEKTTIKSCLMIALENVLLSAKRKNVEIKIYGEMNLEVYCDTKWTAEALFNILDNAIKYTKPNGLVEIYTETIGIYNGICIQDNGIGIDNKNITKIFNRFYREKNDGYIEGVGIGLSLTREIVMKQGGYITVKSVKHKWSKFSIYLPKNEFVVGIINEKL